jgi:spore germination cell wall hydrolase CwlJ-like protein
LIVGTADTTGNVGIMDSISARAAIVALLLLVLVASAGGYVATYGVPAFFSSPPATQTTQEQPQALELARKLAVTPEQLTPDASQMMTLDPVEAMKRNAAIPIAEGAVPAARPLTLAAAGATDWSRALECMTTAIYYEAAREPEDGQRAVAQVILNRVRHPLYPKTVCGVVYQGSERTTGCQFTFTCDGALARKPVAALWERARKIAASALLGNVYAPVGWATNYHANYVLPYWAPRLLKTATVGAHIFYRLPSGVGGFGGSYAGSEPDIAALRIDAAAEALIDPTIPNDVTVADRPVLTGESQALADRAPPRESGARWVIGSDAGAEAVGASSTPAAAPRIAAIKPAELGDKPALAE